MELQGSVQDKIRSFRYRTEAIRLWSVMIAVAIYTGFSSPTPDDPGLIEGGIAVLLLIGVSPGHFFSRLSHERRRAPVLLLLYGMTIPLLMGLYYAQLPNDMLRDLIPFLYFLLPAFLYRPSLSTARRTYAQSLAWVLALGGAIFSWRFFQVIDLPWHLIGERQAGDNLLYLSSSPLVPFSAVFLTISAFRRKRFATRAKTKERKRIPWFREVLIRFALLLGGLISLAALAATVQRATFVLVLLTFLVYALRRARHSPPAAIFGALITLLFIALLHEPLWGTLQMIWSKTLNVFDNARLAELKAVWDHIDRSPLTVLIGNGWGAKFLSPAAGHVWVRYTHTLLSYMLFKAGLVGLGLTVWYTVVLIRYFWRIWWLEVRTALALTPPLILGLTLYPTFKMLGFGLLLYMLYLYAEGVYQRDLTNET